MTDLEQFANELQDLINKHSDRITLVEMLGFLDLLKFELCLGHSERRGSDINDRKLDKTWIYHLYINCPYCSKNNEIHRGHEYIDGKTWGHKCYGCKMVFFFDSNNRPYKIPLHVRLQEMFDKWMKLATVIYLYTMFWLYTMFCVSIAVILWWLIW